MASTRTDVKPTTTDGSHTATADRLSAAELRNLDAYWRACNYLAAGMIYLRANPLLREPLKPEHVKLRLLGHWGSSPGLSFAYIHLNRLITKYDLDVIFLAGLATARRACWRQPIWRAPTRRSIRIRARTRRACTSSSRNSPSPAASAVTARRDPGSIHEGGELGYSVSHAFGAAFDNPDLLVAVMVGDGEAETGALATSWHSNKFLNPIRDGAVLPILHLNGYKINNPTLLARISHDELEYLFKGYGWTPHFVEGDDPALMHQQMAATLEDCVLEIRRIQQEARTSGTPTRARWPMIVLRSPKGWTGPKDVDGHKVEGFWRAHQVPLAGMHNNPAHMQQLEDWLRSYKPEELFDASGRLRRN